MAVLFIRLCGPMQSWGTQSRFTNRDTQMEPSKSGVIGLVCAGLGRPRDADIDDLAGLKMGIRVDREGKLERDYHTAGGHHLKRDEGYGVPTADGGTKKTVVSERFYLANACFLVVFMGDDTLLEKVDSAIRNPVWQLYLGRKSFVPALPVALPNSLRSGSDAAAALASYPFLCHNDREDPPERLRTEVEAGFGIYNSVKHDQPISFRSGNRRFALRYVRAGYIVTNGLPTANREEELCISLG